MMKTVVRIPGSMATAMGASFFFFFSAITEGTRRHEKKLQGAKKHSQW
jgi:hypothetical protein